MVLETSLCDFKELFLNGDYKHCAHILAQYMHSNDSENSFQGINQRCLKMKSDNIMDKCSSFVRWVIQQNIAVCEWMIYMLNSSGKDKGKNTDFQNRFFFELSQMHGIPATKEHLSLEFIMLYNYLTINLVSSVQDTCLHTCTDRSWPLIHRSFERVQKVLEWEKSDKCDLKHRLVESPLFLKHIPLNGMSDLDKSSLYFLCFAIGWLAGLQKNNSVLCAILKAMKNIMKSNQIQLPVKEKSLKLLYPIDNSSICMFPMNDMQNLFAAGFALQQNNFDVALYYLNKVSLSEWVYFALYAKAFVYYERNQYHLTIQCCTEFWKEQRHSEVQLASRFCNLLGCSYFMQNELLKSQNWFRRAVDLDSDFDLPLYNLSVVLSYLNKMRDATKVLKGLAKKLYQFVSNSPSVFQYFMPKYQSEMLCIESNYFLAHHYVILERYSEATIIFSKLLEFFQKNKLQIFGSYNCERVPNFICLLYVEAAYAYLQANYVSKCIETCDIVLRLLIPVEPTKKSLLSDWVLDTTPLLPSTKKVSWESGDDVIDDDKTEGDLSALNSIKNLENLGIFLQHKEEHDLINERIHEDNFYYTVMLVVKSLAYQSISNVPKAIDMMNRACTCDLELVTKKLNQNLKNKVLEQTIGSDTIHKGKRSITKQHDMLDFVMKEGTSDANFSIEVPPSEYKNDLDCAKNLKLLSSLQEIFLDDDTEIFQSFDASEIKHVTEVKNSNTDEKTLECSSIVLNEVTLLSQIYNNLAILFIMNDQLKNADYYLKHATECMPGNIDAMYNYCLWELKNGNYDNAQNIWKIAKQKTPVISHILDGSVLPFPYSVTSEQVQTLNTVLIDLQDDACVEFDVDWDD